MASFVSPIMDMFTTEVTSPSSSVEMYSPVVLWIVVVGFLVAFVLAFGIGANDVANSFGTSVGSKVLTVKQACILATIFEIAGSVLIGYKVSDTMRKGILDVNMYTGSEKELMLGFLSSLAGSAVWLLAATFLKLPISGTHSIVGATVGFSLVNRGFTGLKWTTLGTIVASWFISPVLSGCMSVVLYKVIHRFILGTSQPLKPGLQALPFFYGVTVMINVFSIVHDGPMLLYFDRIPWWGALILSVGIGIIVMAIVYFFLVPYQKRQILEVMRKERGRGVSFSFGDSTDSSQEPSPKASVDNLRKTLPVITETANGNGELLGRGDTNEMVQFSTLANTKLTNGTDLGHIYSFPTSQTNGTTTKLNGYLLAETTLDTQKDVIAHSAAESIVIPCGSGNADQHHLQPLIDSNKLISGQVTPVIGLSPNSSAVPLIRERPVEEMRLDIESGKQRSVDVDPPEVAKLFSFLQVLTASFGSFAHGGNDVSNAIGPLIAVWLIYIEGSVQQKSETPLYLLFYGGIGITLGLWIWGRRVIKTIGEDLTKITASTGFTIEIGAAFTVLIASKIGIPISTTHCKVGSVVFVGWASASKGGVDWKLFRNIIYAWVVTVPIAAGLSAACMAFLRAVAL